MVKFGTCSPATAATLPSTRRSRFSASASLPRSCSKLPKWPYTRNLISTCIYQPISQSKLWISNKLWRLWHVLPSESLSSKTHVDNAHFDKPSCWGKSRCCLASLGEMTFNSNIILEDSIFISTIMHSRFYHSNSNCIVSSIYSQSLKHLAMELLSSSQERELFLAPVDSMKPRIQLFNCEFDYIIKWHHEVLGNVSWQIFATFCYPKISQTDSMGVELVSCQASFSLGVLRLPSSFLELGAPLPTCQWDDMTCLACFFRSQNRFNTWFVMFLCSISAWDDGFWNIQESTSRSGNVFQALPHDKWCHVSNMEMKEKEICWCAKAANEGCPRCLLM